MTHHLDALFPLNSRFRTKDRIEAEPEEEGFTDGKFLYASPGVRFSFAGRDAIYALAQTPLYQDVNALELTSKINYVI